MKTLNNLPELPNEITSNWLGSVLGYEVEEAIQETLGIERGFMGDVIRVHLKGDKRLPPSVVIKLPKKVNRVFGELLGVYEREIMFFRELGESTSLRIPKQYYSEFDRDKGSEKQGEILALLDRLPLFMSRWVNAIGSKIAASKKRRYILVIEDLFNMKPGDQVVGLDSEQCIPVLTGIAKMHKHYWKNKTLDNHFWLLKLDVDAKLRFGIFKSHVENFRNSVSKSLWPHLDALKSGGPSLMRKFYAFAPTTLIHCDLRLDNILFDGNSCAYIDWQLVRSGPAAFDIAYFLSSALHTQATEGEIEQILHAYHSALNIEDYSYEDLLSDYAYGLRMVLLNLTHTGDVELGDNRGKEMMDIWIKRLSVRLDQAYQDKRLNNSLQTG